MLKIFSFLFVKKLQVEFQYYSIYLWWCSFLLKWVWKDIFFSLNWFFLSYNEFISNEKNQKTKKPQKPKKQNNFTFSIATQFVILHLNDVL